MSESVILTEVVDRVGVLTFNRPEALNALSGELIALTTEQLKAWGRDANIGAIVVTGAGRAFCAGGDVKRMASETAPPTLEQQVDGLRQSQEMAWLLYHLPKVTIAAVPGHAAGAGLGVALSCDLRIASDKAKFVTAYARVGYGGDFGTTWLLTQYVGAPKAKEMFFLSEAVEAEEALKLGLVNRVVPHETLMAATLEMAKKIANGPLTSYRYMKANVNFSTHADFRTVLDREAETHCRCGMTEDHQEGVKAFVEKRTPNFKGR